jgi:hypothetical protein
MNCTMHAMHTACTPQSTNSKTTIGVVRTSSHVRVAREEAPTLLERLADLCNRSVDNLESAKIIKYQEGTYFEKHSDLTAAHVSAILC